MEPNLIKERYLEQINKIRHAANVGSMRTGAADAMPEFAIFLALLSEDAERTAEKNLKFQDIIVSLTKSLRILTIWLLVLTSILTIIGFVQIFQIVKGFI